MQCDGESHEAEFIVVIVNLSPSFVSSRKPLCAMHARMYLRHVSGELVNRRSQLSTMAITIQRIDDRTVHPDL